VTASSAIPLRLRRTLGPGPWCERRAWLLHWPLPHPAVGPWPAWDALEVELRAGGLRWGATAWQPPLERPDHPAGWVATLAARLLQPAPIEAEILAADPFAEAGAPRPSPAPAEPLPGATPALALTSRQFDLLGEALPLAADLLATLPALQPLRPLCTDPAALVPRLRRLREMVRRCCNDGFTDAVLAEAERRGLASWLIEPDNRLYQLGSGACSRWLVGSATDADSHFGTILCADKSRSHRLMRRLGIPVPRQVVVREEEELPAALARVGLPCVVKPIDQEQGRGVAVGLADLEAVRRARREAARYGEAVLVEEQIAGCDHRLTVLGGRFRFAVRREPPRLRGDGQRSVAALIEALNADRRQRRARDGVSGPLRIDAAVEERLAAAGFRLTSVLPAGQELTLRLNANVSAGGLREDVSEQVHPATRRLVEALAATLRLDSLGVDAVVQDIREPLGPGRGALIELNAMPQLLRERAALLLDQLFADAAATRLPVQVLVRAADDGPDPALAALLERLTAAGGAPRWRLAVPRALPRTVAWLEGLQAAAAADRLQVYGDAGELLLDASSAAVLFLIDRRELANHGLPVAEPDGLWYEPAPGGALDAWLARRGRPWP
jgi:D-alanine-D-alanine ligase-like ATP-grasp enzyme